MFKNKSYNLNLIFQALADPTRRAILKNISRQDRSVTELSAPFDMSLAAVSKHLKVLERARLIHRTKSGRRHHCRLNAEALKTAEVWIADYRKFWEGRLDSLGRFLQQSSKQNKENR
ncbi:MAG: metalloregulator ArsR/SmtB family transcription factor [Candidatus Manganitrophus sp. SA1]|nr:metalloregulator ArsR/SmtB family transcription factor [Candidatus Manganitrophus morganii]